MRDYFSHGPLAFITALFDGLVTIVLVVVALGLAFLLARFLLVATKVANHYLEKNGVVAPKPERPAAPTGLYSPGPAASTPSTPYSPGPATPATPGTPPTPVPASSEPTEVIPPTASDNAATTVIPPTDETVTASPNATKPLPNATAPVKKTPAPRKTPAANPVAATPKASIPTTRAPKAATAPDAAAPDASTPAPKSATKPRTPRTPKAPPIE